MLHIYIYIKYIKQYKLVKNYRVYSSGGSWTLKVGGRLKIVYSILIIIINIH